MGRAWDLQDREADAIEDKMKEILEANAPALLAIFGCGTVSAAALAVAGGGNPERLGSEAEFASLCGVAPLLASSGKTERHRLNRGGDRRANRALYQIAVTRMSYDQRTKDYVEKRKRDGKSKKVNCLPFLGQGNRSPRDGRLSMSVDLRLRYDRSLRERAAEMFGRGLSYRFVARGLGVPAEAVRDWQETYRATGRDGLLKMGKEHARYDFETKVAAARAVVDDGMAKPEAMERFGIASATPLKRWCRLYREGGAEALRPRPKGRPRGSCAKAAPMTREQELEREVRRLEAQVAYLKKSIALKAELRSRTGRRP